MGAAAYFTAGATAGAAAAVAKGGDGISISQQLGRRRRGGIAVRLVMLVAGVILVVSLALQAGSAATLVFGDEIFRRESMESPSAKTAHGQEEEGSRRRPDQKQHQQLELLHHQEEVEEQQQQEEEEEQPRRHGLLEAAGRDFSSFPSVTDSTIMFLHVFKCAGTSLREVLTTWAKREGWSGVVVEYCKFNGLSSPGRICLNGQNDLVNPVRQKWMVAGSKLLAGHFLWDFRQYATPPYLMITTLRNPLELFVSSQQFMHKDKTRTLEESVAFVTESMRARLRWADPRDLAFIRRFLDVDTANRYNPRLSYTEDEIMDMVVPAVEHLNTFFIVGVVEQYRGFIEVLKRTLDPELEHRQLWAAAVGVKDNGSPVHSGEVLRNIDPELVREFNASSLSLQWQVYEIALQLWDTRCREVLPPQNHHTLCMVPNRA